MNRAFAHTGFGQHSSPSVRERILSSYHGVTSTSGRCCSSIAAPTRQRRPRQECLPCCAAAKSAKSGSGQGFKGFGEPPKAPQKSQRALTFDRDSEDEGQDGPAAAAGDEDENTEEITLKPAYRMYTDGGFKAQRYVGSMSLQRPEGESQPLLCTTAEVLPGDLLLVSPAIAFVEGDFQQVPELEDLHAAMLEDGPSAATRRVLAVLEELRPGPQASAAAAAAAPPSAPTAPFPPPVAVPSLSTLETKFWTGRGRDASAPAFTSQRLMRLLGRAATSSDTQDPAASQARHQKPVGYMALWPEPVLQGHSCVPNTSQLVVADRLLVHATDQLPPGTPLTANLIGQAVTSPLSYRQRAVEEALGELGVLVPGRPPAWAASEPSGLLTSCRCPRCQLEARVSEGLRDTLEEAYRWFTDEASETWGQANQDEDVSVLRGLLDECMTMVTEVEEAVQGEPGLDDLEQDWLRASVYDVYDLLVTLDELVNQEAGDPDYLQRCLELIRVHSPGSESHMMVALKHEFLRRQRLEVFAEMLRRDRVGPKAVSKSDRRKLKALRDSADTATEMRLEAAILRYGFVDEETLGKLTDGLETYLEGVEQMSMMAAQGLTEVTREMEVAGVRVQVVDKLEVSEEARVGPSGARSGAGGEVTKVINQDGMAVMVVNDAPAPSQVGSVGAGAGTVGKGQVEVVGEEDGDVGGDWDETELLEVDPDVEVDDELRAALEAALAEADWLEGEEDEEGGEVVDVELDEEPERPKRK